MPGHSAVTALREKEQMIKKLICQYMGMAPYQVEAEALFLYLWNFKWDIFLIRIRERT